MKGNQEKKIFVKRHMEDFFKYKQVEKENWKCPFISYPKHPIYESRSENCQILGGRMI